MTPYLRWVWTNTWAIVIALALHSIVREMAGQDETGSLISMVVGALIIGSTIGWAQSRELARRLPAIDGPRWIGFTIIGAALVLLVGMTTTRLGWSVNFASFEGDETLAVAQRAWSAVLLTQIAGFAIGLILGVPQARALPAPAGLRVAWVAANGAGWSLGMLLTTMSVGFLSQEADLRAIFAALFAGLALTGVSVGVFTGLILKALVIHPTPSPLP